MNRQTHLYSPGRSRGSLSFRASPDSKSSSRVMHSQMPDVYGDDLPANNRNDKNNLVSVWHADPCQQICKTCIAAQGVIRRRDFQCDKISRAL
jgi:hypothetical protein